MISLLKKALGARAGLGFGLELMKRNTGNVKAGAVTTAVLLCYWDDCTAPPSSIMMTLCSETLKWW